MAYETKPNTGSLFKNDRKESDTHPDYKGQALINGVECWLDAWINESNSGTKYMALKFKPKDAAASPPTRVQTHMGTVELDDDVPF
jgi:uncharacterized protein (DUF736 family)